MHLSNFPLPWSPDLSVKVKEIDEQHRYFVSLINKLYAATLSLGGAKQIPHLLAELSKYADVHFATEEKYFDKFQYEDSAKHKDIHAAFKRKIVEYAERYSKNDDIIPELLDFVEDWLLDHLNTYDKKYSVCFNSHGLF